MRWRRRRSAPTASSWPRLRVWRRACWRCGGHGEKQREKEVVRSGMLGKPCRQFEQRRTTTDTDRQLFFFHAGRDYFFFHAVRDYASFLFGRENYFSPESLRICHITAAKGLKYSTRTRFFTSLQGLPYFLIQKNSAIGYQRLVVLLFMSDSDWSNSTPLYLTADWFSCATLSRTWLA